jgi:hypothetical protein
MSSVPQRPRNDTAGTQEVKTQRRQKPLRASSTSSSQAVVNLELVVSITFYGMQGETDRLWALKKQQTVSTRNKYAKAADILAGKGLVPAANFSFVDEWNKSHDWDDIDTTEQKLSERDGVPSSGSWPLKSHMNGGMVCSLPFAT